MNARADEAPLGSSVALTRRDQLLAIARALVWRELVVRYKRSVLGIGWALMEPLALVVIYTLVFGYILGASKAVNGYPLFALFGVLAWTFLSSTIEQGATVLLEHAALLRKIAFRWELLVLAVVVSRATTCAIGIGFGLAVGLFLGQDVVWANLPLVLVGFALLTALTTGLALVASAIQVLLRDTSFLARFALRLGFYLTPVAYPLNLVPDELRDLFLLNPLVGIMWCFQSFTSSDLAAPPTAALVLSAVVALVSLVGGIGLFARLRPLVADLL